MLVHFKVDPRKKKSNGTTRVEREDMEGASRYDRSTGCQAVHARSCDLKFNDLSTNDNNAELV